MEIIMFELTEKDYQRFCKYIEIGEDGILRWIGSKHSKGYGTFHLKGKKVRAHRVAFFLWGDTEFDPELHVLHKIDDPAIVDPRWLYQGTNVDNQRDKAERNRMKGERHSQVIFTEEQVIGIRADIRPVAIIAAELGVSRSAIYSIKAGRNWGYLTTPINKSMSVKEWKRLQEESVEQLQAA